MVYGLRFANTYGSPMVLQRAPDSAVVWGYAESDVDGQEVTLTLGDTTYTTATFTGKT